MKALYTTLFSLLLVPTLAFAQSDSSQIKVKIAPTMATVEVNHRGTPVTIKRNSEFARKLLKLDNSAQALLAKLVADGNNISNSDQDYLGAMQDLQNDTVSPDQSVNLSETNLINRVDISDSGDLYHKLFEANPQVLSNLDTITTGQGLRVPL